jgi:hypothetical protein
VGWLEQKANEWRRKRAQRRFGHGWPPRDHPDACCERALLPLIGTGAAGPIRLASRSEGGGLLAGVAKVTEALGWSKQRPAEQPPKKE